MTEYGTTHGRSGCPELARRVREARQRAGLTQAELADRVTHARLRDADGRFWPGPIKRVGQGRIAQYEGAHRSISTEDADRLRRALGDDLGTLTTYATGGTYAAVRAVPGRGSGSDDDGSGG